MTGISNLNLLYKEKISMDDPYPDASLILQILILFILIWANAFLSLLETAVISLNDNKLEKMADENNKKAKKILRLTKNTEKFLFVSRAGITFTGFLLCAFACQSFAGRLTNALDTILPQFIPESIINALSIILITVLASFAVLLFGVLVPKSIAPQIPEKLAFPNIGLLAFISKLSSPFVSFLFSASRLIVRLLGFDPDGAKDIVTEEEIRMLVDEGEEKGVIENVQKEMINNIFEFDDIDVSDIMTHRTDICTLDVKDSLRDVIDVAIKCGYSRIPVFENAPDNIIGIAYVKDLLSFVGRELPEDKDLRSIIRKAYYIPESKPCGELLAEMTESHVQMAIVVDEYGGTAGLVTLEDLLEEIVGNIQDEYDHEDVEISKIDDATFTVDGATDIDEVAALINVEFPRDDYDTLGGFLINELGYLPAGENMDAIEYKNYRFTVLGVEDRRIGKVRLEILPKPDGDSIGEE